MMVIQEEIGEAQREHNQILWPKGKDSALADLQRELGDVVFPLVEAHELLRRQVEQKLRFPLYLAHPFDSRAHWRRWELLVERDFGVEIINPFYDEGRDDVERFDRGELTRSSLMLDRIVPQDLQHIKRGGGVIAVVDGATSYGTIMEIVYATLFGKPVYLICTNGLGDHMWLAWHATSIFTSAGDFVAWLAGRLSADTKPNDEGTG